MDHDGQADMIKGRLQLLVKLLGAGIGPAEESGRQCHAEPIGPDFDVQIGLKRRAAKSLEHDLAVVGQTGLVERGRARLVGAFRLRAIRVREGDDAAR